MRVVGLIRTILLPSRVHYASGYERRLYLPIYAFLGLRLTWIYIVRLNIGVGLVKYVTIG